MNKMPFISVIIPVRNGAKTLAKCLESLKNQNYPHDKFEIIISDGMSKDNTARIVQDFGAKIINNPKYTVGPGRNIGFSIAQGELIAFSDDDCVMDPNWLLNSIKYFDDIKVGGISGPAITPEDTDAFSKAVGFLFKSSSLLGFSSHRESEKKMKEVKDLPGCNAIYRREALEKVFPIDENLLTAEDVEMNFRIRELDYRLLYVPDFKLWHYRRQTLFGLWKQMYRFAIGRVQVGRKNIKMVDFIHVLAGLALPFLILISFIFYFMNIKAFFVFVGLLLLSIPISFVFGLIQSNSFAIGLFLPLVLLVTLSAWSLGFWRELLFPIKHIK